ncbi:MAG: hypothetical protein ACRDWD_09035 [Acidimicrobiia bacterium]
MSRVATTVWRISPDLISALDEHLGTPLDSYVNGTQTWLTEDGPGGTTLEWRLHPAAAFLLPAGLSHYELWDQVVGRLAAGADPESLQLGDEARSLASVWGGLECYAAYGEDTEPAPLAGAAHAALGQAPDGAGTVDHGQLGEEWERSRGRLSLVDAVLKELET